MGRNTDLLPSKEGVKDKTGIRHLVVRQGLGLRNATGVVVASFAELGVRNIVAGTVGRAPGVFVTDDAERWMGQVILFTRDLVRDTSHKSVDVRILKSRDQDPGNINYGRITYTFQRWSAPASTGAFPWGSAQVARESAPTVGKGVMSVGETALSKLGGILTSIFLSSMALGSLAASKRAAMAEYSMLKGRPVSPSLSSLMAFVLSSFWKDASGLGWRRVLDLDRIHFGTWRRTWT